MDYMHKQCKQLDPIRPNLNNQLELNGLPTRIWIPNVTNASPKCPEWLAESKGVLLARKARWMKIGPEWPGKPNKTALQEPMVKAGVTAAESGEPCEGESKSQWMKNFLRRSFVNEEK